jgi:hypothetical protein
VTASLPAVMGGEHRFVLSHVNGGTRLVRGQTFRGILVPFSGKSLARAEASFRALGEALKKRAEASFHALGEALNKRAGAR